MSHSVKGGGCASHTRPTEHRRVRRSLSLMNPTPYLGCAGWSLPRDYWPQFDRDGTHLQRYASRFNAAEINSSFYRPHRAATYARWASSVPLGFRFSVKVPKHITHELRLEQCQAPLDAFLDQCMALGPNLGCLLVQLPPSFTFEPKHTGLFFEQLRQRYHGAVALEPRHPTWLHAGALLTSFEVAWVQADPAPLKETEPLGWGGLVYLRLHGSPKIYYSAYSEPVRRCVVERLNASEVPTWCIFDNTAAGAAVGDALWVHERLLKSPGLGAGE